MESAKYQSLQPALTAYWFDKKEVRNLPLLGKLPLTVYLKMTSL